MISVVIPCFNEERRIAATLRAATAYLAGRATPWEIVVVDDGSLDGTSAVVRAQAGARPEVRLLRNQANHGKGWAVRVGCEAARGELVLFTDADLATPIAELSRLEAKAEEGFDVVIASRHSAGSRIVDPQPVRRRISSWCFRKLVRVLGLSSLDDTQCGFKLMRRDAVLPILRAVATEGFAFDVELLFCAERAGLRIAEVPVEWHDREGSKLRLYPDALRMAADLMRMRRRLGGAEPRG